VTCIAEYKFGAADSRERKGSREGDGLLADIKQRTCMTAPLSKLQQKTEFPLDASSVPFRSVPMMHCVREMKFILNFYDP
jgi:hypothetical protein